MPETLTARLLLRHIKPLKLPERLLAEPAGTAIFADQEMREALTRRAEGLAGRLMPLEAMAGGKFNAERIVICALGGNAGFRMRLSEERPGQPVRVLTDDYLLAAAAGLDPWADLAALETDPLPASLYAVTCLPRSGSTYFCHLLRGLKNVARPTEHLRPHILFLAEHGRALGFDAVRWMRLVAGTDGDDGLFGTKVISDFAIVLWPHLSEAQRADLAAAWSGAKLIHLERSDKVAQAVSQFIADETRIWHVRSRGDESAYAEAKQAVAYDGERIAAEHERFVRDEGRLAGWLQAWSGPVHHLTYEALIENPQKAISEAAAFIRDEPARTVDLAHEKYFPMSDAVNRSFAERFRGELAGGRAP